MNDPAEIQLAFGLKKPLEHFSTYDLEVPKVITVRLLIVGINRSLSYTHRSIQKELKGPLEKSPKVAVNSTLALIHQEHGVQNAWSGEFGALEQEIPGIFEDNEVQYLDGSALRASVRGLAARLSRIEDTWQDQGKSIENALVFLKALSALAPEEHDQSDIFVLARPDVIVRGRLGIVRKIRKAQKLRESGTPTTLFPAWGTNSGLNDVFAVVPREHTDAYFRRFHEVPRLLEEGSRFHSESFLKLIYRNTRHQSSIHTPMVRVRIGGAIPELDLRFEKEHRFFSRIRREVKKNWRGGLLKIDAILGKRQ